MKKISLGALALVFACATVFADGHSKKVDTTKPKTECAGQCQKNIKTGTCKDKNLCTDMNACRNRCS